MDDGSRATPTVTAGLVLGDQYSYLQCLIDSGTGNVMEEGRLRTTEALRRRFDSEQPLKIAIEVGTHWPPTYRAAGDPSPSSWTGGP